MDERERERKHGREHEHEREREWSLALYKHFAHAHDIRTGANANVNAIENVNGHSRLPYSSDHKTIENSAIAFWTGVSEFKIIDIGDVSWILSFYCIIHARSELASLAHYLYGLRMT